MLIEFTGCTGCGKTTFSEEVIRKLSAQGFEIIAVHPKRFFAGIIRKRIANETIQNVIMDSIAIPMFLLSLKRHRKLFFFCAKTLIRDADSTFAAIMCLRGIIRKVGIYEFLQRRSLLNKIVIVDEGVVHSAHNLFVHLDSSPNPKDIVEYSLLIPVPDILVYVRCPKEILLKRTLCRSDQSRRIRDGKVKKFLDHAYNVFEVLISSDRIAEKTITVDCSERSYDSAETLAKRIVLQEGQ
jgi:thymidylate kinase